MGKPRMIIIIRHAQSEGNKDKNIHQSTPDHKVGLTPEGHEQAREAGRKLRDLLRPDDTLHFFISPYRRTRQTTEGILETLCSNEPAATPFQRPFIKVYEEPRLREQDFGNFQPGTEEVERLWRERAAYGHFFYRIPNGESGADCYDRVSSFNGSLWRRFKEDDMASVAILVTHGLCSRIFLMVWYHYSVEFFEDLRNINHCEFLVMKLASNGRYVLQNQLRRWSDLKRERAERRSVSSPIEPAIPVRRWVSQKRAHDANGSAFSKRPVRRNTADLFKDDSEIEEEEDPTEDSDDIRGIERPDPASFRKDQDQNENQNRTPAATPDNSMKALRESLAKLSPGHSPRNSSPLRKPYIPYLGRDGGGSRSGAASPFSGSDEEDEEDDAQNTPTVNDQVPVVLVPKPTFRPHALAQALQSDLGDPGRILADALGDQSDAEVDEADKEMGTKERERKDMAQILAEERRERTHHGSVY